MLGMPDRLCWVFLPKKCLQQDLLFRVSMSGIQSESMDEHFDKNWWQVDFPHFLINESFFGQVVFLQQNGNGHSNAYLHSKLTERLDDDRDS